SAPAPAKDPDVDCLLDPNLAKCKGGGGGSTSKPKETADPSLPAQLGTAEIKKGIDQVKGAASSCGSGVTVAVKFSVKGSTGAVVSAVPDDTSAVGKCVAAAAKKAKFPKFQAAQQGFTFKFRI